MKLEVVDHEYKPLKKGFTDIDVAKRFCEVKWPDCYFEGPDLPKPDDAIYVFVDDEIVAMIQEAT